MTGSLKRLAIIRHAKAEPAAPGLRDRDRDLMPQGVAAAKALASALAEAAVFPDQFLSSSASRAAHTADLVAEGLGFPKASIVRVSSLYEAEADELLAAIREISPSCGTLFLCGHNPSVSELLFFFSPLQARELSTAVCALIEVSSIGWSDLSPSGIASIRYFGA